MSSEQPNRRYRRYLLIIIASFMLAIGSVCAGLIVQQARGELLPARITNRPSLDAKLTFFRNQPAPDTSVWIQGSSFALNHFVDSAFVNSQGQQVKAKSLAAWGLPIDQQWSVLQLFQRAWQTQPKTVVLFTQTGDYSHCNGSKIFSPERFQMALDQLTASQPKWLMNLRAGQWWFNFWPPKLAQYRVARADNLSLISLRFSDSGSVPFHIGQERKQHPRWLGPVHAWSRQCLPSIQHYMQSLASQKNRLVLVWLPIRPALLTAAVAQKEQELKAILQQQLGTILTGSNGLFLDAAKSQHWTDDDFADAIHLQAAASARLTAWTAKKIPSDWLK